MSNPDPYDPHSPNAMFARVMQRLDSQDATLARIERHAEKTNGRVTALERWRDIISAKAAAISGAVALAAWLIERLAT